MFVAWSCVTLSNAHAAFPLRGQPVLASTRIRTHQQRSQFSVTAQKPMSSNLQIPAIERRRKNKLKHMKHRKIRKRMIWDDLGMTGECSEKSCNDVDWETRPTGPASETRRWPRQHLQHGSRTSHSIDKKSRVSQFWREILDVWFRKWKLKG